MFPARFCRFFNGNRLTALFCAADATLKEEHEQASHRRILVFIAVATDVVAQEESEPLAAPEASVLDKEQWKRLDSSLEKALQWLISQQNQNGLLTCCQAMYQLGGRHWRDFYPPTVQSILANQLPDGSWPAESVRSDSKYGTRYTTSLCVLSLGAPNQLLPIFQR